MLAEWKEDMLLIVQNQASLEKTCWNDERDLSGIKIKFNAVNCVKVMKIRLMKKMMTVTIIIERQWRTQTYMFPVILKDLGVSALFSKQTI